jgi:UDP-N-acetylmuramate dehydrogenase
MAPDIPFSELTTLRVGGPARRLVTATTQRDLVDLARETWDAVEPWLVLGGGSNLLVGDEGFDGTVIRVATRGIEVLEPSPAAADDDADRRPGAASVRLRVQAGENWDDLVVWAIEHGYSGFEALSGIPGSVGAAPVQNIGAYGQELESTLVAIEFLDEGADAPRRMSASELELGYRTSVLKQGLRGIVVSVEFDLHDTALERAVLGEALGQPIAYGQLADALHVNLGDRVPISHVREGVLGLRAAKGMVLDPSDPDSVSAGSFFTNPILTHDEWAALPGSPPAFPEPDGRIKTSAAWLIERSGFARGYESGRAGISTKHTLALVNRGGATTAELMALAREIAGGVRATFGVSLTPEPVLVGHTWSS